MRFVVCKFGGTSVSTLERWNTIGHVIEERLAAGLQPVIVCSALTRISDLLEKLVQASLGGSPEAVLAEVRERHRALAEAMGLSLEVVAAELKLLERLSTGISLTGEATPRLQAQMMATGELMSTRLGAAYLRVKWVDARDLLTSDDAPDGPLKFLSATCSVSRDPSLQEKLAGTGAILTQGFIARTSGGDTVLLGRGGSDTSAAYLAARLGASECEIWTDVPGIYTADPRQVPQARVLRSLDYREAQELASMGAKVLHPRCLAPVRDAGIPLQIRCTQNPHLEGTRIEAAEGSAAEGQVKAVSSKSGVTLISMESQGMWQQVGFLAEVFSCFKAHRFSIDLVGTSESNVTVTLDSAANLISPERLEALLRDLSVWCRPRAIAPCAAVSLVGTRIRSILHRLAPALELFEEEQVHLVSQASSDLNLTFVVDQDQADRLTVSLHNLLFSGQGDSAVLGPTWQEQFRPQVATEPGGVGAPAPGGGDPWWVERREELLALATPSYVYCRSELQAAARRLKALDAVDQVFYAMKANPNRELLAVLAAEGLGFETVSPGELARVREAVPQLGPGRLLYTPNFASRADFEAGFGCGAQVTLDNLEPLEQWPDLFANRELFLRIDPGRGGGHHKHVRTAGPSSKFGIAAHQLSGLSARLEAMGSKVIGLHAHAGSGILDPENWQRTANFLVSLADQFPHLRVLDLGGGLGVPDRPAGGELDLGRLQELLRKFRTAHPHLKVWLEPGRYLVAQAGLMLVRVNQVKRKGDKRFIGVDSGMNGLIRPALYGAYHEIVNLTRLFETRNWVADVVGPICESGDILGRDRLLPATHPGDTLAILTAGAYGHAMSSTYNLRPLPDERLLA